MPRTKKSATDVKIDQLARDMKEIKEETKSLRADINKGKGAIWIILVIAGLISSAYNFFTK